MTKKTETPKATFFKTPGELRAWFAANGIQEIELWVGYYKKDSGRPSVTWPESVDQALCFGWIDGIRKSVDDASYAIRFTPRKPGSIWSAVNIKRATELEAEGKMHPAGLEAFHARNKSKAPYSFESPRKELDAASRKKFEANKVAWGYYQAQAPWYRRTSAFWVMEAKRPETREKRLGILIDCSADGKPIPLLTRRK